VGDNDKLNIVQHPDGRLKEVALRDNQVTWQNGQLVHYRSDTEPGSSGAPVFNDIWELVALHHAAADDMSNEGIKFSALATLLEQDAQNGDASARELLKLFQRTADHHGDVEFQDRGRHGQGLARQGPPLVQGQQPRLRRPQPGGRARQGVRPLPGAVRGIRAVREPG
jgi:hypothetical protein